MIDLSPEGIAAQARKLHTACVDLWGASVDGNSDEAEIAAIAAALGAVCDAARAERAEEVRQLRESLGKARTRICGFECDQLGGYHTPLCRRLTNATEPSHG